MSLIYSLIAKEPDIILCGYSESTGNFEIYCQKILKKIHKNAMASYQYQDYIFHVYNKDSITYLAFSDKSYKEKVAYDFLETIHGLFTKKYSKRDIDDAISYSFKDFEDVLKEQMTFYNNKTNINSLGFLKYIYFILILFIFHTQPILINFISFTIPPKRKANKHLVMQV